MREITTIMRGIIIYFSYLGWRLLVYTYWTKSSSKSVLILSVCWSRNFSRLATRLTRVRCWLEYGFARSYSLTIPSLETLFSQIFPLWLNITLTPQANCLKWFCYVLISLLNTSTKSPFVNFPYFRLLVCRFTVLSLLMAR